MKTSCQFSLSCQFFYLSAKRWTLPLWFHKVRRIQWAYLGQLHSVRRISVPCSFAQCMYTLHHHTLWHSSHEARWWSDGMICFDPCGVGSLLRRFAVSHSWSQIGFSEESQIRIIQNRYKMRREYISRQGMLLVLEYFIVLYCQRPVSSLGVSQHMYEITNPYKIGLNWSSNLKGNYCKK